MLFGDATAQSLTQLCRRCLQAAMSKAGELRRIGLAGNHRLDHRPGALAHNVGDHRIQFDVGILEGLLHALNVAGRLTHQLLARAHQSPQFLRLAIGHKARANETVRRQIDYPFGIADIGLAAGHILHMSRIGQHQLELAVG